MTIVLTGKNQITIPKKLINEMHLVEGALFDIQLTGNRLELIPLETIEKVFSDEEYIKMDQICKRERGQSKPLTRDYIKQLKTGKA